MPPPLDEKDLVETFCRSSGPGGQNVNKVNTAVTLLHKPSGLSVRVQTSRSQEQNRAEARELLAAKLAQRHVARSALLRHERELRRRQRRPRPRGLKEKILRTKKHRSALKKDRRVAD